MFAVTVRLTLAPDAQAAFMPLMLENARASLNEEPDCHRFDVARDPARPDEVFLYELYTDEAGFQAHLETVHFQAFDQATAALILDKSVTTYREVRS